MVGPARTDSQQEQQKCPHKSPPTGSICDDPQLPKREIAFYLVALASIITYAGYGFYLTYGQDQTKYLPPEVLKEGWMRKYKDIAEDNLLTHAAENWKFLALASLGYLLVSKATLVWAPMACHHIVCAAYTLAMTALVVSPETAVAMVILYCIVLCLSYYSYAAVWVVVGTALYMPNISSIQALIISQLNLTEDTSGRFTAMFGYLLCRLVSVGHSLRCRLQNGEQPGPTFSQHIRSSLPLTFHYTFYMPYQWCGPILTYDMFCKRLESRGRVATVDRPAALWVAWRVCRILLWFFVLQLIYHYLPVGSYLYTLQEDQQIVYKHLSFSMFLHGQNFMLVYVQFYGWPAVVAKLDGVQLLDWPDCISWVYSYSIMWRVFDRGLFAVLRAHVYLPLGGNRHGVLRQILAVVACFTFICVFHGDTSHSRAWVALNVAQLMTERLVVGAYGGYLRSRITKYLGPRNEKRLVGYVMSWNMMVSCGIIFFLLAGPNGFIVLPEFLLLRSASRHTPVWHMLTKQFGVYCCVQIGRYYESKIRSGGGCKGKFHTD